MADGYQRVTAQSERVSRVSRRDARDARRWMDEFMVSQVDSASGSVVQVEGNRLAWWRTRRRLRRNYGVVATRVDGAKWMLRRQRV